MTAPVRRAGPLLSEIVAYCAEHPYTGNDLELGVVTFQQTMVGTERVVSVLGDVPQVMGMTMDLLDAADQDLVSFDRGRLVLNVVPKLSYEPLYVGRRAEYIVFRRVCTRCHNSRKIPDWTNWNEEYGEPRPKPCPECLEWPQ